MKKQFITSIPGGLPLSKANQVNYVSQIGELGRFPTGRD